MEEDEELENQELGVLLEKEVNRLAALFYQSNGRGFMPDHKFREAKHPEEKDCWNKALIAFSVINKDSFYLQFQV